MNLFYTFEAIMRILALGGFINYIRWADTWESRGPMHGGLP